MENFIASFLLIGLAMFGLSLGVVFKGKQIKGHCGNPSLEAGCGVSSHESECVKDEFGNKIAPCATCDC